jgi:hypothetical protein
LLILAPDSLGTKAEHDTRTEWTSMQRLQRTTRLWTDVDKEADRAAQQALSLQTVIVRHHLASAGGSQPPTLSMQEP